VAGGAGSAVHECLAARGLSIPIYHLGLPDRFVDQGERCELLAECGLDVAGVLRQLTAWRGSAAKPAIADA
jgi:1-deoxy-D-xylulose-5-phosphate synthase